MLGIYLVGIVIVKEIIFNFSGMSSKSDSQFRIDLSRIHSSEIISLQKYETSRSKILFRHSCGNEWTATPDNILRGRGCPKCSGSKYSMAAARDKFSERISSSNLLSLGTYVNAHTKILVRHTVCSNEFEATPCHLCLRSSKGDHATVEHRGTSDQ